MAIETFKQNDNTKKLENAEIKLGRYNTVIIEKFTLTDEHGEPCGLWDYYRSRHLPMNRINLYIYSTSLSELFYENSSNQQTLHQASNFKNSIEKTAEVNLMSNEKTLTSNKSDVAEKKSTDDVTVRYLKLSVSKYSQALSVAHISKYETYKTVMNSTVGLLISFGEFEPSQYGFDISTIIVRNKTFLEIEVDSNGQKSFQFPSANSKNKHSILHDHNEIFGTCDGKFGLGCIPFCDDVCKPIFTWYKNKKPYQSGPFLYWLEVDQKSEDDWHCEVKCQGKNNLHCTSTEHTEKNHENSLNHQGKDNESIFLKPNAIGHLGSLKTKKEIVPTLSQIRYADIDWKNSQLLGRGGQGEVHKAKFLKGPVAVKTISRLGRNNRFILREINICEHLHHANIIQVMAICFEPKKFHIVMEYVDGHSLYDILFKDVGIEYSFDEDKKNLIAKQICTAIAYLHLKENPVIHRDLKPGNIMVTKAAVVKLCDLGLSRYANSTSTFRTTVGSDLPVKGTPLYLSPEQFLKGDTGSFASDIWALGCTFVELYSEECVWDLSEYDGGIKEILLNKRVPNFEKIPKEIIDVVMGCFIYEPEKRLQIGYIAEELDKNL